MPGGVLPQGSGGEEDRKQGDHVFRWGKQATRVPVRSCLFYKLGNFCLSVRASVVRERDRTFFL